MIKPISQRPLAFIDTETTGLDSSIHEVIEVAVITEHPDGRRERFHTYIKPQNLETAHPKALEINGYAADSSKWDNAPHMEQVGEQIARAIKGCILVGHNVGFDIGMLQANMDRAGLKFRLPYHKVDTVTLAYEHLVPCGLESLSMDKIRKFLGWSMDGAHTAMKDAEDARRLYRLCNRSGKFARFLIRWGGKARQA